MKKTSRLDELEKFLKLTTSREVISFCDAKPDSNLFPIEEIKKIYFEVLKNASRETFQYRSILGYYPLRELIASDLNKEKLNINPDEVAITSGSQLALDLLIKTLLPFKSKVVIEEPTYIGIEPLLTSRQSFIKTFPIDDNGLGVEELENFLAKSPTGKPALIYLMPDFQNPTGTLLSLERRKIIAYHAKKYAVPIIEDQIFKNLFYDKKSYLPSIKTFYPEGTIITGSISKTIMPGLRVGWIVASKKLIPFLTTQIRATMIFGDILSQMVVYEFWQRGLLKKHLQKIRLAYCQKRNLLIKSLEKYFPKEFSWSMPTGGFFIWVKGPKKLDTRQFFFSCLKNRVAFLPGSVFYSKKVKSHDFRLSFSTINQRDIELGIKKIAQIAHTELRSTTIRRPSTLSFEEEGL